MIITIKGSRTDIFKDNNIGTLSTWPIRTSLGTGATYNGVYSVDKNAALNATVTLNEGYELDTAGVIVSMGGNTVESGITISGSTITISIPSVTGSVVINVSTKKILTEEPETPTSYTITYKYVDSTGATIQANTTETVNAGTVKNFTAPTIDGYTFSSASHTSTTVNSNITVTYTYTADAVIPSGTTVFDLDFTTKTLDDYVNEGVITIPSTSKTDELVYDAKGLTTNKTGTAAQLLNGAKLTNTFDIARDWTFEVTMTIDPWQEDFGMTEALYNNFMFVTAPEHEMPMEDGKNHGSNCFTPAIYDNGGTFTGRFPTNGNVGISGANKTITADGVEHTYKWVHTESDQNNAFYKDGTKEKDTKWTNTSFTFGGQFGYILGAHSGYSSASNFCLKKGFHIKSMKLYTN